MEGSHVSLQTLELKEAALFFLFLFITLFFPPSFSLSSFFPSSPPYFPHLCFIFPWLKLGYPQSWVGERSTAFTFSNGTSVAHITFTHVQLVRIQSSRFKGAWLMSWLGKHMPS